MWTEEFEFEFDENAQIKEGPFAGYYLEKAPCRGEESFRKMVKRFDQVLTIWALVVVIAVFVMLIIIAKTRPMKVDPYLMYGILMVTALCFLALDMVFRLITRRKILKGAEEYRAVLYRVHGVREGRSVKKECYFAILHNGRVRVVKEFILLQPLNRLGAIRKEQQKLGYEYTVKASPDTTGCCVRNHLN